MKKLKSKDLKLEILISTMFRENLDFLNRIFVNNSIEDLNLIIVNQTTKDKVLKTNLSNIKIINSFERGSPNSRNLAIKNATADICLMADDDIVYNPNLKTTILKAYQENPEVDMISFEAINEDGDLYTKYYPSGPHNKKSLMKIFTWVISFKREVFIINSILFNRYFGVGSTFKGATEYVFLRNAYDIGLKMMHISKCIVIHQKLSSGVLMGSDNAFFAKTALKQRFFGNLSYVWLIKYTLYMWKDGYINFNEIFKKFKIGLKGISTYKALKNKGEIDRINGN